MFMATTISIIIGIFLIIILILGILYFVKEFKDDDEINHKIMIQYLEDLIKEYDNEKDE